jgi:hypothetical protein
MLRIGYTGGAVDVYKPTNPPDTKVYAYDINSMYPYVMSKYDYPVGTLIFFVGTRDIVKENLFVPNPVYSSLKGKRLGVNSSRVSREEVPSSGWRFHLHLEAGRDGFMRVKVTVGSYSFE